MRARRVFETVLYARDLVAVEQFYRDVFGLEVLGRGAVAAVFRCGDGVLLIFNPDVAQRTDRGVPSHGTEGPGHLAFAMPMDELDSWREHFRAHNVQIEMEVAWPEGGCSIYVRDPAGNSVELAPPTIWGGGWDFQTGKGASP
jgi:catechol-2,3-dioxygenase